MIERYLALMQREYYRYRVTFGPYVMTPSERLVTNISVIFALLVLRWVVLLYFPRFLYRKLIFVVWLLTGYHGCDADLCFRGSVG